MPLPSPSLAKSAGGANLQVRRDLAPAVARAAAMRDAWRGGMRNMDVARVDKRASRPREKASSAPNHDGRRRGNGRFAHTYAALDLGTNNCRLLVARATQRGFRVIDAFSRIVRLGEGVGASGIISEPAMDRTIQALAICAGKIHRRRVTRARLVATEACRKAENRVDFLERVSRETGLDLEIISTHEEARLAISGCLPLISRRASQVLVFDIGGGSTEVIRLDRRTRPSRLATISLPLLYQGSFQSRVTSAISPRLRPSLWTGRIPGTAGSRAPA